ncbi:MAG: rhodanese-like domain-containing protein [Flavobacteriales bacterium]
MAHAEHRMDAEAFLAAARESVVLDVRSPSEHAQGHLPGAISFPLFLDEERAVVGKTYKQVGQTEAIETGLGIVGPKLQALANRARALFDAQARPKPLLLYCREVSIGCFGRPAFPPCCAMADTRRAEAISITCSKRLALTSWWGA